MSLRRIDASTQAELFDAAGTRRIEQAVAASLPPHALMQRAGLAVARLAMALAPHARCHWVACGPGNNGGDGFEAASQLRQRGFDVVVTALGDPSRLPPDARNAFERARDAGVRFENEPPAEHEFAIDALLGVGASRPPSGRMDAWLQRMRQGPAPWLSVDLPSGLEADTGRLLTGGTAQAASSDPATATRRACLGLLTLKPGLFMADGRDAVGELWFDDLGVAPAGVAPVARLPGRPPGETRAHAVHKGSFGDVAIVGGAAGMAGAALLAATAALHAGAGRVYVAALDPRLPAFDPGRPELMFRPLEALAIERCTVVCGCGGGDAVGEVMPRVLDAAARLVLDADALNQLATQDALAGALQSRTRAGRPTVLTPHPLEAARLLATDTATVQADRLGAATRLAQRFGCTVVLKGSGTVVAAPGRLPVINPTGNGRLATAGTGDVLAGMIASAWAAGASPFAAAWQGVWRHGRIADDWPAQVPLTAAALAQGH